MHEEAAQNPHLTQKGLDKVLTLVDLWICFNTYYYKIFIQDSYISVVTLVSKGVILRISIINTSYLRSPPAPLSRLVTWLPGTAIRNGGGKIFRDGRSAFSQTGVCKGGRRGLCLVLMSLTMSAIKLWFNHNTKGCCSTELSILSRPFLGVYISKQNTYL